MNKRLYDNTKWLTCLVVLHIHPGWAPVEGVAVESLASDPKTVEAQAKFFQDFFSVQLSPYKIEFGHVCEDPNTWEQRYESNDFKNHRAMGKVRWGDKKGGYGEHYWDLNHAGHGNDHHDDHDDKENENENDDGSYDPDKYEGDAYDEPSAKVQAYQNVDSPVYSAERASYSPYYESGRRKRHHRVKNNKKHNNDRDDDVTKRVGTSKRPSHKLHKTKVDDDSSNEKPIKDFMGTNERNNHEEDYDFREEYAKDYENEDDNEKNEKDIEEPKVKKPKKSKIIEKETNYESNKSVQDDTKLVDDLPTPTPYSYLTPQSPNQFVPYEHGAGVRQHYPAQTLAAADYGAGVRQLYKSPQVPVADPTLVRQHYQSPAPGLRLFLEPSTGRVVDRATGQAYLLQPVGYNI